MKTNMTTPELIHQTIETCRNCATRGEILDHLGILEELARDLDEEGCWCGVSKPMEDIKEPVSNSRHPNNPLQPCGWFDTPESPKALQDYVESLGPDKRIGYLIMMMTLNLASQMVDESLKEADTK